MQLRWVGLGWVVSSGMVLGGACAWTILSSRFVYGEGHALRPIPEILSAWWLIFAGMLLAWHLPWRSRWVPGLVLGVGLAARIVLWPSALIQENDVYRYVLDGQVLVHGENPYRFAPAEYPEAATGPLADALSEAEAQVVLSRIGYPHLRTIYPPGAQLVFAAGAWLGGWDWRAQRLVLLGAELLVALILWHWLGRRSQGYSGFVLYWWNPLVLKELANSAHLDVLPALGVLAALWIADAGVDRRGRQVVSGLSLAAGGLFKLYPLILLPAWITDQWRQGSRWVALAVAALVPGLVIAGYLPFADIGWGRLTEGLAAYSDRWVMNEGVFGLLALGFGQPRWLTAALIAVVSLWPAVRKEVPGALPARCYWLLLIWFLLIPTPFPWYALPIITLLPLVSRREALPAVVLSGVFSLYYLRFLVDYRGWPEVWWVLARVVEHGSVWLAVARVSGIGGRLRQRLARPFTG